jgi:restriction system protein
VFYEIAQDPQKLLEVPPRQFEELVARILAKMGYSITFTALTMDGGYDLIASAQSLPGLPSVPIIRETKSWC